MSSVGNFVNDGGNANSNHKRDSDENCHVAVAALQRIEEVAADLHSNSRRLRRARAMLQLQTSSILSCEEGTTASAVASSIPGVSRYQLETEIKRTLTMQHRWTSSLMWRNVLLAGLWERLVVQGWYRNEVVEGFFSCVMTKLAGLERRLERAAAALRPDRRVRSMEPAALMPACTRVEGWAGGDAETQVSQTGEVQMQTSRWWWWSEGGRRRELRTVLFLCVRVVGEYIEQRCSGLGEDLASAPLAAFTVKELSEVMQYILRSATERQYCLAEAFTTAAQKPAFLQALHAFPTLQRCAQDWGIGAVCQGQLDSQCKYERFAQTSLCHLREKTRTTSDMLVNRRQQRERDEARWYSLRAAAVSALQLAPPRQQHDAVVSDGTAAALPMPHPEEGDAHTTEAFFDASECTLSLMLNMLHQQWTDEVNVVESTGG